MVKRLEHLFKNFKVKRQGGIKMLMLLPIFVPNDLGLVRQVDSIRTLNEYLERYPIKDVKRIYCGWCKKEEYWTAIRNIIPDVIRLEENMGKSYIINKLVEEYGRGEKFFFTCDSDICFELEQEDIFRRLQTLAESLVEKKFGLISLNQHGHNCQFLTYQTHEDNVTGEHISWGHDGRGLAGGALFLSTKAFEEVGKYRELGPYGSDDGFLMIDMKAKGFFACCARNIYVFHPAGELKVGYAELKSDLLWHLKVPEEVKQKLTEFWSKE